MSDTNALRQRIAEELGQRPSNLVNWQGSNITVAAAVNREINSSIRHYESRRFRWNEVRESQFATTVDGTRTYSLPADFVKMDTLKVDYNNAWIFLNSRTWEDIEERDRQVTGTDGLPFDYAIYGNVLRLYPIPNGAYPLYASYVKRFRDTSLTGSFCTIMTMGGGSLTMTTTASHNNQVNGWTTDGEDLIRARSCAAVRLNYLYDDKAAAEFARLAAVRMPFLSYREKVAFERLADETNDAQSTGKLKPYMI